MGKLVTPKVFFIGSTALKIQGMVEYLKYTNNEEFKESMVEAFKAGLSDGEILCSFYAKLCYKSLTLGKNDNVTKIRDIHDNLKGCISQAHGSVFEHCVLNFVATDCSRVLTHELVRHRAGTAFSQTSGRYVRGDSLDIVFDPILEPVRSEIETLQYLIEERYRVMVEKMGLGEMKDFSRKKKITSALRRILPNGQSNEIGFSINLRSLRHVVQLRTSRYAEWEVRDIFNQVYFLIRDKYPLIFSDAKEEMVDGVLEITGMRQQPYDYVPG